jgi:hypothetical protein
MIAPESRRRAIAFPVIVSFLFLLAAQALPQAARSEQKKPRHAAAVPGQVPGFMEQAEPGARVARRSSRLLPSLIGLAVAGAVAAVLVLTVFKKSGYNPHIIPQEFVAGVSNPYFPLVPGQTRRYSLVGSADGLFMTVTATANTRMIMGVLCLGVQDRVLNSERLFEDTWRWYAQDQDGNVWYFARETKKYDYDVVTEEWSWQAGTDGAKPGMVMVGNPQDYLNREYRQDFVPGVSENKAQVLAVNETVTVAGGTFSGCVKVRVYSAQEPGQEEIQYFAPDVGLVLSESLPAAERRLELVSIGSE